jgi:hypothetical protein
MEFGELLSFFTNLNYARRKYPMSVTYTKYLQRLHADNNYTKQNDEVDLFRKFLVSNPEINTKTLTCEEFRTGKSGTIINMKNFLLDGHVDDFWSHVQKINNVLFVDGKPVSESFEVDTVKDGILKQFQSNRLLADTFAQIQKIDVKSIANVGQLLESETFQEIVNKLSGSFSDGTYSTEDVTSLTSVVTSVVDNLSNQEDINDKTRDSLKIVANALECMKNKKEFDVNRLLNVIGDIDLSNP